MKPVVFLFILGIYQYALFQTAWIKCVPAFSLSLITNSGWTKTSLLLAGMGDFLLEITNLYDSFFPFILGIISFSFCQLILIKITLNNSIWIQIYQYPKLLTTITIGTFTLYPIIGYFIIPILFYALLLFQLLILLLQKQSSAHSMGCLLFILSDIFVLMEMVLKHSNQTIFPLKVLPTIGLPLYWTSLLLIAINT